MILRCLLEIIHNPHLVCDATFTLTVIRFTGLAQILPDFISLVLKSSFICLLDVWVLIPAPYHATSFWTLIHYVQPSCHTDNSPDALKGQFLTASNYNLDSGLWTLGLFDPVWLLRRSSKLTTKSNKNIHFIWLMMICRCVSFIWIMIYIPTHFMLKIKSEFLDFQYYQIPWKTKEFGNIGIIFFHVSNYSDSRRAYPLKTDLWFSVLQSTTPFHFILLPAVPLLASQ